MRIPQVLMVTLCLGFSATGYSQNQAPDIRSARWGMTIVQVKNSEKNKPAHESTEGARSFIFYDDTIRGLDAIIGYVFVNNQLVRAQYMISEKHTNNTDYVTDYQTLSTALKEKYGSPSDEQTIWKDDLYRDDPSDWGMAVAVGHLVKFSEWITPRTEITLLLKGDNFDVSLAIEYTSVELKSLEENTTEKEEAGKL